MRKSGINSITKNKRHTATTSNKPSQGTGFERVGLINATVIAISQNRIMKLSVVRELQFHIKAL
ncbi:hypothetical protein LPICM17_70033 [Lactococcus piscium]|nr:hypothetical protein LP2241_10297 [Lactococcus piscium]SOB48959.1 hypothetical protein LPICM17_70033 [Lactococcus piscium]